MKPKSYPQGGCDGCNVEFEERAPVRLVVEGHSSEAL